MGRPVNRRRAGEDSYKRLFGEKLDQAMRERRVSNTDLARELGTQGKTVGTWRNGDVLPALYDVIAIAEILDVEVTALVHPEVTVAGLRRSVLDRDERRMNDELVAIGVVGSRRGPDLTANETPPVVPTIHRD